MQIQIHSLHATRSLDMTQLPGDCLHAVRGRGRGGRILVPQGWLSMVLTLHGRLDLQSQHAEWQLQPRRLQIWLDGPLHASNRAGCWWIMLTAPAALWSRGHGSKPEATIFPWETPCPRDIARPLVHLARPRWTEEDEGAGLGEVLGTLLRAVADHEAELQACLARCSGRTLLRRQQTLLRLLRVQHLIRSTLDGRMDLARLAASANYSPCHLLRVYREVFGETPSEYAARLRYERAWQLVRESSLSVCEISQTLGFESESAFCRAFKHIFGCTTSEARRGCPPRAEGCQDAEALCLA